MVVYQFSLPLHGFTNKQNSADNFTMAPYVDFMNHSCDDHCTLKIDGKGFQVRTTSQYNTGDQVYLSYGPHSNDFCYVNMDS